MRIEFVEVRLRIEDFEVYPVVMSLVNFEVDPVSGGKDSQQRRQVLCRAVGEYGDPRFALAMGYVESAGFRNKL